MPIEGIPDPEKHRICRRCQQWFELSEGTFLSPEITGPLGAVRALRATIADDSSVLRFQCHRCTRIRRKTQQVLWFTLIAILVLVLVLEKVGVLN